MITEDQIKQATEDTAPALFGEVLQPEKNKHDKQRTICVGYPAYRCMKCDEGSSNAFNQDFEVCPVIDLIPLTPANAFKWRDWAVEKFGKAEYVKALLAVFGVKWNPIDIDFTIVAGLFACELKPIHYLKAASLCEIRSKK